jgi:hypothetical protein
MKTTKSQTKEKMRGMHKEEKVNTKQKRKQESRKKRTQARKYVVLDNIAPNGLWKAHYLESGIP